MSIADDIWNEAIDAAEACSREKNWASPNQIRKLKNGDAVWDEAIEKAAGLGTGKRFASPDQIKALRK